MARWEHFRAPYGLPALETLTFDKWNNSRRGCASCLGPRFHPVPANRIPLVRHSYNGFIVAQHGYINLSTTHYWRSQ